MKKKKKKVVFKILLIFIILIMTLGCVFCYINVRPISNKSSEVLFNIETDSSIREIALKLKDEDLIRSEKFFLLYSKINHIDNIKAGTFKLNRNMSLKQMTSIIQDSKNIITDEITITFKEGQNMRAIAKVIDEKTVNSYNDVMDLLKDKDYMKSLIDEYWFLDETILNENIYYPLEGYLAPDTYNFEVNAKVEDIFKKLLDQTDSILTSNKENIEKSKFSTHELLTLASIVESEGVKAEDRKLIAGVFINRLNNKMSLGSDVTTYYAAQIDLGERDLYMSEINSNNPYNTRSSSNAGKLPIGPICNPSKESIDAVINYTPSEYLYFVADKNMNVYFTKTDAEHNAKVNELKQKGLWYEY